VRKCAREEVFSLFIDLFLTTLSFFLFQVIGLPVVVCVFSPHWTPMETPSSLVSSLPAPNGSDPPVLCLVWRNASIDFPHSAELTASLGGACYINPLNRNITDPVAPASIMRTIFPYYCYYLWLCSPARAMASLYTRFLDHTQRRATVGRTPLDEWSARRRDLYLTTHNRQTSMPPVGFETKIAAGLRPRGHWDRQLYSLRVQNKWNLRP
jgi:hypothetical protein